MVQKTELLVHIGAPSTRQHDENYKAQAKAYLDFTGHVTTALLKPTERVTFSRDNDHNGDISNIDDTTSHEDEPTTFLDDTQAAYNALESQLATSSLEIPFELPSRGASQQSHSLPHISQRIEEARQSAEATQRSDGTSSSPDPHNAVHDSRYQPRNGGTTTTSEEEVSEEASIPQHLATTPAGVSHTHGPSQSSYLKSPVLNRSSKRRKLSTHPDDNSLPENHHAKPQYIPLPTHTAPGLAYIGDRPTDAVPSTQPEQAPNSHEATTSELPTSYELSDITTDSSRTRNRPEISRRSGVDSGARDGSGGAGVARTSTKSSSERDVGAGLPRRQAGDLDAPGGLHLSSGHVDEGKMGSDVSSRLDLGFAKPNNNAQRIKDAASPKQTTPPASTSLQTLQTLPLTIHPPSPPAGHSRQQEESHITPSLHFLTSTLDLEKTYRPVSVAREIRGWERGCWVVPSFSGNPSDLSEGCVAWDVGLQAEFWAFLEKTVGTGRAGWGVWCCRSDHDEGNEGVERVERGSGGLGTVKVFCWGEVVPHIYLLLYVASKSQVRKLGLRWVDGAGEVVVRMRGS